MSTHVHPTIGGILAAFAGPATAAYRGPTDQQVDRLAHAVTAAEDVVDPCHAADADVRPDPYDGGCPADCNTPPGRVTGDTDGERDAKLNGGG